MAETADVVIIGAGIIGCSIAYHLSLLGTAHVTVVEQDLICSGSTGRSAGGIRQQFGTELNIRLSQESVRMFERMPEELGVDPGFRKIGYLFLASSEPEMQLFRENVSLQQRMGVPVRSVSVEEIRRIVPYLRVDGIVGGTHCPVDGYAAPYEVTMGYAAQARRRAVTIHEQRSVTAVLKSRDKITGVMTSAGPIHAPIVVNAAGPAAGRVGDMAGVDVPIRPYRRQLFTTHSLPAFASEPPLTVDYHRNWYFRGELGGCLFSGPKDQESTFNTNVDWEHLAAAVEEAVVRLPLLSEAEIHRGWAGLYEITPDNNAILGPVPELSGFFVAGGHSGHGFQHGPMAGKLMAEMIVHGRTSIDISALSIGRFRTGATVREAMTMHQA